MRISSGAAGPSSSCCSPWRSSSSASRGRWTPAGPPSVWRSRALAIAEWWKFGLTGKHLTARRRSRTRWHPACWPSPRARWRSSSRPASWGELLLLSQTVAAITAILYHAANAHRIASSGRHLDARPPALIVGTPYVFGSLVLLEPGILLRILGDGLTAGLVAASPAVAEFVGRVLVLFCFNEAVATGLGLATGGRPLRSPAAHLAMLAVAIAAVAAPWVAALGSGRGRGFVDRRPALAPHRPDDHPLPGRALGRGLPRHRHGHGRDPWPGPVSRVGPRASRAGDEEGDGVQRDLHGEPVRPRCALGSPARPLDGYDVPGARRHACSRPWPSRCSRRSSRSFDGSPPFFRRARRNYQDPLLFVRGAVVGAGVGYGLILGLPARGPPEPCLVRLRRRRPGLCRDRPASRSPRVGARPRRSSSGRATTSCTRSWAASSARPSGSTSTQSQVSVVVAKFHRYLAAGRAPELFDIYPLVSKWGHLNLGRVTGGVSLLFAESLAGVISWSTAAWLFAINRTFMRAYFWKDATPIRELFTKDGHDPARREHDPGAPLGPVDVADHQLVPAADGDADLVQPGRGDPHRPGDLPGLRR